MTAISPQIHADECEFVVRSASGQITRDSVQAVFEQVVDGKGELVVPAIEPQALFFYT